MRRERINDEAAAWVVRLAAPHGADVDAAFAQWRAIDIDHLIAFERQHATWQRLNRASALRGQTVTPDAEMLAPAAPPAAYVTRRRMAAAAGLLLATGAGTGLWLLGSAPAYATGLGEQRLIKLRDGTSVELNTDSKIIVRYARDVRVVELVRGEALFHIANESRPFMVTASQCHLYAQQADVAVRLTGGGARIMIKNGFATAANSATPATPLAPGFEATINAQGVAVAKLPPAEVDRLLAWQHGAVAFNGQPLAEVVAEFNRYNKRKLVIGDPSLASVRVGGYFQTSNLDGFLRALAGSFAIAASSTDDSHITLTRRG